ncbi:MAG: cytochrome P450 [Rhodobiaceae bacterium]|nr:cytochrome P450 [Rhodobiaceae bacterium]
MTDKGSSAPSFPMKRCPFSPPPEYEQLRESDPITPINMPDGNQAWLLTRYEDVRRVLSDPRFSTNPKSTGYPVISPARIAQLQSENPQPFIRLDPPDHTRYRRMLTAEFVYAHIEAMRPTIEKRVEELLDEIEAKGPPVDFLQDFGLALPTSVISDILGVPYSDREFFQERSKAKLNMTLDPAEAAKATIDMREFLDQLYGEKLKTIDKTDDLITRLIKTRVDTGEISRQDAVAMIDLLLIAGHETTSNMICLGILSLLMHPDQKDALIVDPSLIDDAVEEMLRYHTILHMVGPRVATDDVEVGGHQFHKGDGVMAMISAANRDPSIFPEPDKFDIRRRSKGHVGFGFGVHQCLGQPLARVEMQSVFKVIFQRFPDLRLAVPLEDIEFNTNAVVYGIAGLPLTWTPR